MKDEIKEIDITKDLYLCSPLLNTGCMKENCYINNGPCCHTVNKEHSQQHLLDYITNLQEENEKLKEKVHNQKVANAYEIVQIDKLQTNNKTQIRRRKKEAQLKKQYKSRIDKAIEYIESSIENSKPDLYNDDLDDLHILLNILQGSDE